MPSRGPGHAKRMMRVRRIPVSSPLPPVSVPGEVASLSNEWVNLVHDCPEAPHLSLEVSVSRFGQRHRLGGNRPSGPTLSPLEIKGIPLIRLKTMKPGLPGPA